MLNKDFRETKVSKEEAIKVLLSADDDELSLREEVREICAEISSIREEVSEIKGMLSLILSTIVISQKNAGELAGVSPNTIRNKVLRGEIKVLSANGSNLNYLTLRQTSELKPQSKPRRRRR